MKRYHNEPKNECDSVKNAEKIKLLVQVEESLNTRNPKIKNPIRYIIKKS